MSIASRIIEKFGGTRKLAAAMELAPSTVQSWKDAGTIPNKHQVPLLRKALEIGIALAPADFFPSNIDAVPPPKHRESSGPNPKPAAKSASARSRFISTMGGG